MAQSQAIVQSWLANTQYPDDDNDSQSHEEAQTWDGFIRIAKSRVTSSRTKQRTRFLTERVLVAVQTGNLGQQQYLSVFQLLTLTYPRYADRPSRQAVLDILEALVEADQARQKSEASPTSSGGIIERIIAWLSKEVDHVCKHDSITTASSSRFILLTWCITIYTACLRSETFVDSAGWKALLSAYSKAYESVIGGDTRAGLRHSATVQTRRSMRKNHPAIPATVKTLTELSKSSISAAVVTPLVGLIFDVAARLRPADIGSGYIVDVKPYILSMYTDGLILSKTPVPPHASTALRSFIEMTVSEGELVSVILPAIEKAVPRAPEVALGVTADFFATYTRPLSQKILHTLVAIIMNCSKSMNGVVRSSTLSLFSVLASKVPLILSLASNEIIPALQSGKTASPEHRQTLFAMLAELGCFADVSSHVVEVLVPLLSKESNEGALSTLSKALTMHLSSCLKNNQPLKEETMKALAKEMSSQKLNLRRAVFGVVGVVLYTQDRSKVPTAISEALAKEVIKGLEVALKNVSTNPLNNPGGPFEGYVAVTLAIGPLGSLGSKPLSSLRLTNPIIKGILSVAPKPSFLLWDKVYKKVIGLEDELWLLRAAESIVFSYHTELDKVEQLRTHVGSIFLHLAIESPHFETRKRVLDVLRLCNTAHPETTNHIIRDSLTNLLLHPAPKPVVVQADEEKVRVAPQGRIAAVLSTCATFDENIATETRQDLVSELVLLAHHPEAFAHWIELTQIAKLDPKALVDRRAEYLRNLICSQLVSDGQNLFKESAARAATTLAFVSPDTVVPVFLDQINTDLEPKLFQQLTATELAIWATPEGTAFIDVLVSKKQQVSERNKKDYEIEKWESELRQSLAKKKTATTQSLSKQDRALVDVQLAKETKIRQRITSLRLHAERGLSLIRSLVAADLEAFRMSLGRVVNLLLEGVVRNGGNLVGPDAFKTYLEVGRAVSGRVGEFRDWIGVATLRSYGFNIIPYDLQSESVPSLVTRVLYRLRSLAEQSPFDSCTFTYISPLLNRVIGLGGISPDKDEEDTRLEQVALSLDLIKFHTPVFSGTGYPRLESIVNLLRIISTQSKLLQTSVGSLGELGDAIKDNATPDEIQALIHGTLYQEPYVRNACLQALQPIDLTELDFSPELWIACSDDDEPNARVARHLWEDNGLDVSEWFMDRLLPFLEHDHLYVRASCAKALADALLSYPHLVAELVQRLQDLFMEKAKILLPEYDAYGMVIPESLNRADPWPVRVAIAASLEALAESFTEAEVVPFFDFLINKEALGDRSQDVRRGMLNAGTAVIDLHGQTRLPSLITMFESYLAKRLPPSDTHDYIKEAVVILFGRVARHLSATDERIPKVVDRLVDALKTPSEVVQSAVAECLPPLVKGTSVDASHLIEDLLNQLGSAPKYATRRGAAYGLAGVIQGRGISAIKEYKLIERLRVFVEDKKHFEARQGALFAIETLSATLGRLFEPYIIQLLPLLLSTYGDATPDVREATQDATRVIMSNISGYGVKLILPSLLSGLDEKQWRTKKGSIEMLGAMAYCAPKQLSISLPTVIPRLTSVLTDSHAQVRAAANTSLKQFGEVINNPEIQSLVPVLLRALVDPATKTPAALRSLIETSFAHYIDSPSLALVIPIIERGLRERGSETKRRAAQIVGNLASLTDSKDFVPYLERLVPLVRTVLVDPVPEARATAAKALGTLVERLGEVNFPDLMPSLLQTLRMDTSGVDRQGAAQGLSEVLSGLGMDRLEALLPEIITNARSPRPYVREGFMSLLVYLPATFGPRFAPHIPRIIPPVLGGLADDEETVRDTSMRAGRIIISNYSKTAIDLLLPELERSMFDSGWRIRQSSVTLLGELLFKITGISGKTEIEEEEEGEDVAVAESSRKALVIALGKDRRDRILAAVYVVRQDAIGAVRQSAIHIWKALVHNTPRTVREILPALINLEISLLASRGEDQRETAARTMGELCRKMGEKILGAIVPILKKESSSEDPRIREGVCLALCEIMENTTENQRENHEDAIIDAVRDSLVDESPRVRTAAAQAFDVLQEQIGAKAIDQTIPTLLQALRQPGESAQTALQALREMMAVRASTVLPALLPTLLATPMTSFNARALKSLVSVAGKALSRRLTHILGALIKALESEKDETVRTDIEEAMEALLGAIADPEGLNSCMMLLLGWAKNDSPTRRAGGAHFFATFCRITQMEITDYRVDWIRQLVSMLDDRQADVVEAACAAVETLVKTTEKEDLEELVVPMRRTIESTGAPGRHVPGFCLSKGIAPLVPIILAGLTAGTNEQKEQAAYTIGDIVQRASEAAIKPYVVQLTGPLIRVITQATTFPPQVKSAILASLTVMLTTIPTFVRPFFPQLQRTFIKSSSDPASLAVRNRAGTALGVLMALQTRVDPVVTELIGGVRSNDPEIRSSLAVALAAVVKSAGKAVGEAARESVLELVAEAFTEGNSDSYNAAMADTFSALGLHDANLVKPLVESQLTAGTPPSALSSLSIASFLEKAPDVFYTLGVVPSIVRKVITSINLDQPAISRPAREARDLLKSIPPYVDDDNVQAVI